MFPKSHLPRPWISTFEFGVLLAVLATVLYSAPAVGTVANHPSEAQEQTLERLAGVVRALEAHFKQTFHSEENGIPAAPMGLSRVWADIPAGLLARFLGSEEGLPEKDSWGHPLQLRVRRWSQHEGSIEVRSPGRDGQYEADDYLRETFPPSSLDRDLVWSNEGPVRIPVTDELAQRLTAKEMRQVGRAMFLWLSQNEPQTGSAEVPPDREWHLSAQALEKLLVPDYLPFVPERDFWGNPYEYRLAVALDGEASYAATGLVSIRSRGAEGQLDVENYYDYPRSAFDPQEVKKDLVWVDDQWLHGPGF
ncbi:MAG: type II secretion system protein GspG [Deltaproteobacteria bacterium]|nr:type II secretion system protein GspG [Deltaproteobacteria bacterium]